MNPLNSIPSLIPLPSSHPKLDPESDIDKFATLFNPQTPPASPDLPPIFTQSKPTASIRSSSFRLAHKHGLASGRSDKDKDSAAVTTPGSADSDFGCFVSVPPAQDPLSESFFPSSPPGSSQFGSITAPIPSAARLSVSSSTSSPNSTQAPTPKPAPPFPHTTRTHTQNPSLDFFGKFVEDAKKKEMTGRGRGYLDELLKHEDDPLYWVKADGGADNHDEGDGKIDGQHADGAIRPDTEVSLLDLDSDIQFAASGDDGNGIGNGHTAEQVTTKLPDHPAKPKPKPFATPSLSPAFPISSRSPPRSQPPPRPISTQPTSTRIASGHEPHPPSLLDATSPLVRSSSSSSIPTSSTPPYNSLSSLSSRWMSSLLSSSQPSPPSVDGHPSIQDIFPSTSSTSSDDLPHPRQHPRTQSSLPSPTAISTLRPQHSTSFPFTSFTPSTSIPSTSTTSSAPSTISHGTPFGSRLFIPPSGAPGFAGESAWDKGFSNDYFDNERVDRKSVRLEGRREMTSGVLEMELVDLIRPHLPALARLPRTWSLLYSLDQHGISLNTLYTRCEPQAPTSSQPKGSLVVMKDSGDAIFGAWLGEGLREDLLSVWVFRFLWRYVEGKLDVYKWTGKNDYVALCEPEYLSFGGGDGRYGLYLDDTLLDGSSARCPTFENEPLCSPGTRKGGNVTFECVGLEVWATPTTSCINLSNPSEAELQHLSEAYQPATFGVNQENVYDESYRKALQMDTSGFATKFAVADSSLMDVVRSGLLAGHDSKKAINAELYKLNVYGFAGSMSVTQNIRSPGN
ncbi:hypothetical protein PILCRDRAFT_14200 [Piloderma croceum F 1598]|uniref:Oxidation resistance protein 1 n=1 Tax=Piloderma croceum (strain F 1598) TaxID=765440 RepID=A0A0C3BBR4_PILCF|nr:hypothetical protein PILCRDRAFT_14200 [Piloderma croceum F 1598]